MTILSYTVHSNPGWNTQSPVSWLRSLRLQQNSSSAAWKGKKGVIQLKRTHHSHRQGSQGRSRRQELLRRPWSVLLARLLLVAGSLSLPS